MRARIWGRARFTRAYAREIGRKAFHARVITRARWAVRRFTRVRTRIWGRARFTRAYAREMGREAFHARVRARDGP